MFKIHGENFETILSQEVTSATQYVYSPPEITAKTPLSFSKSSAAHRSRGWSGLTSQVTTLRVAIFYSEKQLHCRFLRYKVKLKV